MKWGVWLLALVNIALFAYFQLLPGAPDEVAPGHEPVRPELMRILSQEEAVPPTIDAAAPAACYAWGSFPAAGVARAEAALRSLGADFSIRRVMPQDAVRYWVYIPPRRSLAEARSKAEELRLRGVEDFYIVQEPQWRHAISLGLFKDERLADNLLSQLEASGVASAVKGVRNQEGEQVSFYLGALADTLREALGNLQPDFPGSEIRPVPCEAGE